MSTTDRDGSESKMNRFTSPQEATGATPAPLGTDRTCCGAYDENGGRPCHGCPERVPECCTAPAADSAPSEECPTCGCPERCAEAEVERLHVAISRVQALHREWERKSLTGGAEDRWRAQVASELNAALRGPAPTAEETA